MESSSLQRYQSDGVYYFNAHRPTETVLMLKDRYAAFSKIRDTVVRAIFDEHGYDVRDIRLNENNFGTGHVIYFVETQVGDLVYRWNIGLQTPEHYMSLEQKFIHLARQAGFPTNTLLASDTTRARYEFDYQIMETLPGLDAETEWSGSREQYDRLSYELGKCIALEYKMPVEWWGRFTNVSNELRGAKNSPFDYLTAYLEYDLDVLCGAWVLSEKAIEDILAYFESRRSMIDDQSQAYLVHHDIADHNIRYTPQGYDVLAIYDWENAVAFDPISELGSAPTWVCHHPRAEQLKKGFVDQLWYTPKHLDEKIAIYFLRTMLWKGAFAIKGNRLGERHQRLLNAAFEQNNLSIDWLYSEKGTIEI